MEGDLEGRKRIKGKNGENGGERGKIGREGEADN